MHRPLCYADAIINVTSPASMMNLSIVSSVLLFATGLPAVAAPTPTGAELFTQHCAMCHQAGGQGVPNVFPPLAESDFIQKERTKSIQALCEGLKGPITVKGKEYNSAMPMVILDDASVAAVLTHVFSSWGNNEKPVTEVEVAEARSKTKFPTFAALKAAASFSPLPAAPAGWNLREAGQLQFSPVRMAHRKGDPVVMILSGEGNIWSFNPATGESAMVLAATNYIDPKFGNSAVYGIGWDRENHFYITCNQRVEHQIPNVNHVTIWRTKAIPVGTVVDQLPKPEAWFQVDYPWGIGGFNHGISHIAQGPDGMMYVASGSRTDGGETGNDERYSREGETPITACIWKLDPTKSSPAIEVVARGMRNPFGFTWTNLGELYAGVNGPDADESEELDHVVAGKHYGFPFQFGDSDRKPYAYTPKPPDGLKFTHPVVNLGPDGLGYAGQAPASTFTPHSSPAGMIWLEDEIYPAPYRHSFLITRFGNLLQREKDSGFDLLQVSLQGTKNEIETASVKTLLQPLARPIDIVEFKPGKLLIAEYGRAITYAGGLGQPGRILEFFVK